MTEVSSAMVRRVLFVLSLLLLFAAAVPLRVGASGGALANGSFDSDVSGWNEEVPGVLQWNGSMDHTGNGGGSFFLYSDGVYAWSNPIYSPGDWELHFYCTDPGGGMTLGVGVLYPSEPNSAPYAFQCPSSSWGYMVFQAIRSGTYKIVFRGQGTWDGTGNTIDDISAPGAVDGEQPTVTPAATPTRPQVSGTQAAAQVTVVGSTPLYDSSSSYSPMPYLPRGDSDLSHAVRIQSVQAPWSFCLPSAVTGVITGVSPCLTIPVISFVHFIFLGVDLMPYFTLVSAVLLIAFIIRQIQER